MTQHGTLRVDQWRVNRSTAVKFGPTPAIEKVSATCTGEERIRHGIGLASPSPLLPPCRAVSAWMDPAVKKKRRQHYVWRHYLEGWAHNGSLWCRRAAHVFPASVQNVAHQRDFYRLREMTARDLDVVRRYFIEPLSPAARANAESWIPYFTALFRLRQHHEASGRPCADTTAALEAAINNLEEDLHARLEAEAQPFLAGLRAADQSIVLDDRLSTADIWFIAAQYLRTPRMMKRMVPVLQQIPNFNAVASYGLIRTILTTNFGAALWVQRAGLRMTFLHTTDESELITAGQPMVNTRAGATERGGAPEELELYYPLSPRLGVLFDFDAGTKEVYQRTLTPTEASAYNRTIHAMSDEQVYGGSRDALNSLGGE